MRRACRRRVGSLLGVLGVAIVLLSACAAPSVWPPSKFGARPNIVFVLTDDLSSDLIQYMPHVLAMERAGVTFTNYTVSDSLCCPSRSSILTGEFPHDTQIFNNSGPRGGFHQFHRLGEDAHTFAAQLQAVGYRTALMGKYLNGYIPDDQYNAQGMPLPGKFMSGNKNWVAPGWDEWDVTGWGYPEYNYLLNHNHHVTRYGSTPRDYLTTVLGNYGKRFITDSARSHHQFLLELATFAPHAPYTPAPADAHKFPTLRAPRGPAWNRVPSSAPPWLAGRPSLTAAEIATIDEDYRQRVRSVQSVDRLIGALEQTLRRTGQAQNTVFAFSSDNGLHMGQDALNPGKLTAYDTDVRVPLIVTGPHIPHGISDSAIVQNTDLAPTFEQLGGATVPAPVDGRSLVPLLLGQHVPWRRTALVEHHGPVVDTADPDYQNYLAGDPPSYVALRTATFTYVQYADGEHEYYDRARDPYETDNIYRTLTASRRSQLERQVSVLQNCHGSTACWAAAGTTAPGG